MFQVLRNAWKIADLRKIGDVANQPDNAATRGKVNKILHLVEVTEA